jgi:hypothetical protein
MIILRGSNSGPPRSAQGYSLPIRLVSASRDVRSTPKADIRFQRNMCRDVPKADKVHRSKMACYSITSSAIAITPEGMVRPSALAVFRLMARSNLVGCSTGKSAGFSPLRMRPT